MKNYCVDLTEGSPLKQIFLFSIPIIVSNVVFQLYTTADMAIVGRFCGLNAYSAIAATSAIIFLYGGLLSGITNGCAVITSQRIGAKDVAGTKRSIVASIVVSLGFVAAVAPFMIIYAGPLLRIMQIPDSLFHDSRVYLYCIFGGTFISIFTNTAIAQIRAIGDSMTPLIWSSVSTVLNIILNILFVALFNWGVFGVGIATVSVHTIIAVIYFKIGYSKYSLMRITLHELFHPDWKTVKEQIRIGMPMSMQFVFTAIGCVIRQALTNKLGEDAIGAFAIGSNIEALVTLPLYSVATAMATYSAQNYGAAKFERLRRGVCSCVKSMIAYTLLCAAIVLLFYVQWTKIFLKTPSREFLEYVWIYCITTAPYYIFLVGVVIYRNVLQGMGYQFVPFLGGVAELIARGILIFPLMLFWGYWGLSLTNPIAWIFAAVIDYLYYKYLCKKILPSTDRTIA